jgi:hypothetical protein
MLRWGFGGTARTMPPRICPRCARTTLEQIVSQRWYPANRHGIVDDLEADA